MSTPEALRTWIKSELPHLQIPSDETLEALAENSTTKPLWTFLTTRVLHPIHARAARAALTLSGEHFTHREEQYEQELDDLRRKIGNLETEIEGLRKQLEVDDTNNMKGINDVVHAAFEEREKGIRELITVLSPDEYVESDLEQVLEMFGDEVTAESLGAVEECTTKTSQNTVLGVLQRRYEEAERRIVPVDVTQCDMDAIMERVAVDTALKAFKHAEILRAEHLKSCAKVVEMVDELGDEGFVRVLAAQLEGERAVLRFAKTRETVEIGDTSVAERDIDVVENACRVLCEGSLRMLEEVKSGLGGGEQFWEDVRRRVEECVKGVEGMVETWENGTGDVEEEELVKACDCGARRKEVSRVEGLLEDMDRRLKERSRVATEARERVLERYDTGILEDGIRRAVQCREIDAVRVSVELKAFVRQPGRGAAPWLLDDDKGLIKGYSKGLKQWL